VSGGISDSLSGAEGEHCVGQDAKVGDIVRKQNGETGTIRSLSGISDRCPQPGRRIRSLIDSSTFTSKVGINLPKFWALKRLTTQQKIGGGVLRAKNESLIGDTGVYVGAMKRDESVSDVMAVAAKLRSGQASMLEESQQSEIEQITVNGLRAWRYEIIGKSKGLFSGKVTYLSTILEGDKEIVVVNAWTPTNIFEAQKDELNQLAKNITGIYPPSSPAVAPPLMATTPAVTAETPAKTASSNAVYPAQKVTEDKTSSKMESAASEKTQQVSVSTGNSGSAHSAQKTVKSAAVSAAEDSVAENPDRASAWHRLGSAHLEDRNYEKAIVAFNEALKRNPKYSEAIFGLGSTYFALGEKDKARELYFEIKKYDAALAANYFKKYLLP